MASSSKLSHAVPVSNTDAPALPLDALFEVLLRLPAKELYRLRAVCRSWRALTYDPHFATVYKSRHPDPLFAVPFWDWDGGNTRGVAIVGLSGQMLRKVPFGADRIELLFTHLDRLCVVRGCKPSLAARVLNPATGVAISLPGLHSDEFVGICLERTFGLGSVLTHNCRTVTYAFGQVASTGEYKVLRISHPGSSRSHSQSQLCDIITLDGRSEGRWRRKQNPPGGLKRNEIMECIAVNGIVYFVFDYSVMEPTSMAPFDLNTEKWMPTLRGPEPLRSADFRSFRRQLSLANLNGSLAIIDNVLGVSFDLWFLMDHKRGLWAKKYRLSIRQGCSFARPLLILDDGRIVIYERVERLLQCYDPTTDSLRDVLDISEMGLGETQSVLFTLGASSRILPLPTSLTQMHSDGQLIRHELKLVALGFILVSGLLFVCYSSMLFHGEEASSVSFVGTAFPL